MKRFSATIVVILGLALAVWALFYIYMPEAPLTLGGTTVVVGMCAAIVYFSKWIWARLRK